MTAAKRKLVRAASAALARRQAAEKLIDELPYIRLPLKGWPIASK